MPAEKQFQPMKAGEAPSLIQADRANEVIDTCAAFASMTVIPQGSGTVKVAGRTAILDLTGLHDNMSVPEGTLVITLSKNGVPTDYNVVGEEVV